MVCRHVPHQEINFGRRGDLGSSSVLTLTLTLRLVVHAETSFPDEFQQDSRLSRFQEELTNKFM